MPESLITGGAGFIGSHLAEELLRRGDRVTIIDNLSTGRPCNLTQVAEHPRLQWIEADIMDAAIVEEAVERADSIYHLAAAVGVQLIIEDPVHTIETNIRGSSRLLELADKYRRPILLTSTSEVYGKGTRCPFSEDDDVVYGPTTNSRWSYAFSKAVDEFLALAYHQSKGLPAVVVRLFNTVGPRQVGHYGMVLPRFVEQAQAGGPIRVFGDGTQTRCFCHVHDIVPALVRLLETPAAWGQVVNLGSDEEVTIRHLAERVRDKVRPGCEIVHVPYDEAYRPGFEDLSRRVPSIRRAARLIGFAPKYSLDQILDDVLDLAG